MTNSSPRRRGAPYGNTNRLTHGFYSRQFRRRDIHDLADTNSASLIEEIAMLRVFIRRVIELGSTTEDLPVAANLLRILSVATGSLNRLVKTQRLLLSPNEELENALKEAAERLSEEFPALKGPLYVPPPLSEELNLD